MQKKWFVSLFIALITSLAATALADNKPTVVPEGYRAVIGIKTGIRFSVAKDARILRPGEKIAPMNDAGTTVRLVPCGAIPFTANVFARSADNILLDVVFKGEVQIDCNDQPLIRSIARDTLGEVVIDVDEVYYLRDSGINAAIKATASRFPIADIYGASESFSNLMERAIRDAAKKSNGIGAIALKKMRFPG